MPASAQHAALRILLEDVDPLLQRAEEAAQTLAKVREELDADLDTLGRLVQQSLDAQPGILEAGRKLSASAARIETAMQGSALPHHRSGFERHRRPQAGRLWSRLRDQRGAVGGSSSRGVHLVRHAGCAGAGSRRTRPHVGLVITRRCHAHQVA